MRHKEAKLGDVIKIFNSDGNRLVMLVEPDEADPFSNRISVDSPLGKALLHRHKYDLVNFETRRGKKTYTIDGIY